MSTDHKFHNSREKGQLIIAGLACLVVAAQIGMITIKGEAACFNEGCRVVEGLTRVSPLVFNLVGLGYFLAVLVLPWIGRGRTPAIDWFRVLLLAGLAVEGALLAYQVFAVQTVCLYCLTIFACVAGLNLLAGRAQIVQGLTVFSGVFLIFGILNFGPALLLARNQGLASGTYAVKACAQPVRSMYLFFSSTCPHCQEVIKALEGCDNCDFHFNPVDHLKEAVLPGLVPIPSYNPETNRLILTLLGISEVPILLIREADGFRFIKGEGNIVGYIKATCMQSEPVGQLGESTLGPGSLMGFSGSGLQDGGCEIAKDCD